MGQAKLKLELLRKQMLEQGEFWNFPETVWEIEQVKQILLLPVAPVRRMSREELEYMRKPENQCHANARWYADNDPTGRAQMITGWIVQWPNLLLHSVIGFNGAMVCITPNLFGGFEDEFSFIADDQIYWQDEATHRTAWRNGKSIDYGLRVFPKVTERQCAIVRGRLEAGMNPYKAIDLDDANFEELQQIAAAHYEHTYLGMGVALSGYRPDLNEA
jgi:hypothetical protein